MNKSFMVPSEKLMHWLIFGGFTIASWVICLPYIYKYIYCIYTFCH